MALLSRKDVCDMCGLKPGDLSNYIKRQNVILSGDYIDDSLPHNADFLKKKQAAYRDKLAKEGIVPEAPATEQKSEKAVEKTQEPDKKNKKREKIDGNRAYSEKVTKKQEATAQPGNVAPPRVELSHDDLVTLNIKTRNLWLENQKMELEITQKQLQMDKQAGNLIPLDVVKSVFAGYAKGITDKFLRLLNGTIDTVAHQYNITGHDKATYKRDGIDKINEAVGESLNDSKNSIQTIVNEYSESRQRGERKQ